MKAEILKKENVFFLWILFFIFLVTLNYIKRKTLYGHGIDYSI